MATRLILNGIWKSKMKTPVNGVSDSPKPCERKPSERIGPGGPPKYGQVNSGEALLSGLPVLAAVVGIQGFPHRLGSFWFILLPFLVAAVWFALAAYADHLLTQARYDRALRIVPFVAVSGAGRSYLRGDVLPDAGRYEEAERMLRAAIDHVGAMKVDIGLALEDLGNVLMDTGRFEEAQQCFQRAAGIYPKRKISFPSHGKLPPHTNGLGLRYSPLGSRSEATGAGPIPRASCEVSRR